MSEFGRTPWLNALGGRDHWPQSGFAILAGAGIPEGLVIGDTGPHGDELIGRAVSPSDIAVTIRTKLGLDGVDIPGDVIPEIR
jgi:hypothetical protein